MKRTLFAAIACLIATCMMGQQSLNELSGITSPRHNADGSVTFQLYAPAAKAVQVAGDFLPNNEAGTDTVMAMSRTTDGLWQFTTDRLSPEMYCYGFVVDGQKMLDPNNVYLCRDVSSYFNIFIVEKEKGDKGYLYSANDVPHGNVEYVWYDSPTLKRSRRMSVYTPAGYADSGKQYPVMYLLHGSGGDEEAWLTLGRMAQIMDNLIAEGKAVPMIVVMPNGNMNHGAAPGEWERGMYKPDFRESQEPAKVATVEASFPDVMRYVDSHYRTAPGKSNRAICGLSLGGRQSFSISKEYPDAFDYVGLFSAAVSLAKGDFKFERNKPIDPDVERQLAVQFAAHPRLYWIAIGRTDFLKEFNDDYRIYLDKKGYGYEFHSSEGGHMWRNWRDYLTIFAQKVFK